VNEGRPLNRPITATGFARLLGRLNADTDEAASEFETLRRTLIRFFDWRGASPADECADETLDRLCRRLDEGAVVADIRSYAYGIARLVLLERRRRPSFTDLADAPEPSEWHPGALSAPEDSLRDCFDACLSRLSAENRALLLEYYEGERRGRIDNRRRIAAARGLSENALRSRVQRLRDRLESCVRTCVGRREREERL
jgi:DNA-directed RNA polymerase specialized sigma24 family protein